MKNYLIIFLSYLCAAFTMAAENVVEITDCSQLITIPNKTTLSYVLGNDIYCDNYEINDPILFMGDFDGQGHSIHNVVISSDNEHIGLFGRVYDGSVSNLKIENITVNQIGQRTSLTAGTLAGHTKQALISDVTVNNAYMIDGGGILWGYGGIIGRVTGGMMHQVQANHLNIEVSRHTGKAGGVVGSIDAYAQIKGIDVRNTEIYDKDNNASNRIGLIAGCLTDSRLTQLNIADSSLNDADQGEFGINGLLVGYLKNGTIDEANLSNIKSDLLTGHRRYKNAAIAGAITVSSNYVKGQVILKNITFSDQSADYLPWFTSQDEVKVENLVK